MGKTDAITKQYMEDNQVFADAFNYLIYGGREVIQAERLHRVNYSTDRQQVWICVKQ